MTNYADANALLFRLSNGLLGKHQKVVFLIGSALSLPEVPGGFGVPSALDMVDLVRAEFASAQNTLEQLESQLAAPGTNKYQVALQFLNAHYGQNAINVLVRRAVSKSWKLDFKEYLADGQNLEHLREEDLQDMDDNLAGWHLNPGHIALGQLVADQRRIFGESILTSNFDPLVEVAIKSAGGQSYRTVLHGDGNPQQTKGDGCHLIHFHGYWHGADTLHTPSQLQQERPRLKASLGELLRGATVVVLGYGGWDDIFTRSLIEVVLDDHASPEILWSFHSDSFLANEKLLASLGPGIGRGRVVLYRNVEIRSFLQNLRDRWQRPGSPIPVQGKAITIRGEGSLPKTISVQIGNATQARTDSTTVPTPHSDASEVGGKGRLPRLFQRFFGRSVIETIFQCDNPPYAEFFVGRTNELQALLPSTEPILFITGMGGEGKSLLAATYLKTATSGVNPKFGYWDWRDCREQANQFHTQLVSVVQRLTNGEIGPKQLSEQNTASVAELLVRNLPKERALFVFDNVDSYVDLETSEIISGPRQLLEIVVARQANCQIAFTCRPNVTYASPAVLALSLTGLSATETESLVVARGNRGVTAETAAELATLTKGHAFWIDLIAVQAARNLPGVTLGSLVGEISKGSSRIPKYTLLSIWETLREDEKVILRTMAEAIRPTTESELFRFVEMRVENYNRFGRSLRSLSKLNLVVQKPRNKSATEFELHPLVREFVRSTFLQKDRDSFIGSIADVYLTDMRSHKPVLSKGPSYLVLQIWADKIELDTQRSNWKDAVEALSECGEALIGTGHNELYVRLADRVFASANWSQFAEDDRRFRSLLELLVKSLVHLGRTSEARHYLERYLEFIPRKDVRYIQFCDLKCYVEWFTGNFSEAVVWGKKGSDLKRDSGGVDTDYDTEHNLALARRDNGDIQPALHQFLKGHSLEKVLDEGELDSARGGEFYGNIGRCLQFMRDYRAALICYRKSAVGIERATVTEYLILNQAYIRQWVAEVMVKVGEYWMGLCFYVAARQKWLLVSPYRADQLALKIEELHSLYVQPLGEITESGVEDEFRDWMHKET